MRLRPGSFSFCSLSFCYQTFFGSGDSLASSIRRSFQFDAMDTGVETNQVTPTYSVNVVSSDGGAPPV